MYVGSGVRALGDGHVYRFTGWLAGACAREDMRHAGCTSGPAFVVGPWSLSVCTGVASDALYLEASHLFLPVADAGVEPGVHDVHGEVHEDEDAGHQHHQGLDQGCLLYTSDAADERSSVDLGGRRIIKK